MSTSGFVFEICFRISFSKIAIVITDGQQTTDRGDYTELSIASGGLKKNNVNVFALGIGSNVDQSQLTDIASSPRNVFTSATFSELGSVAAVIVENSCSGMYSLNATKVSEEFLKSFFFPEKLKSDIRKQPLL